MKRTILAVILIFALLICLPACTTTDSNQKIYDLLTGYANVTPDSYRIEMTVTSPEGNKVTTLYNVTTENGARAVSYRSEKLNSFILGDNITAPNSYVTVTEGVLDATESAKDAYGLPAFQFNGTVLKDFEVNKATLPYLFTAEVASAEDFMGRDLGSGSITLEGEYSSGGLSRVSVSYVTENGNTVTVSYLYN